MTVYDNYHQLLDYSAMAKRTSTFLRNLEDAPGQWPMSTGEPVTEWGTAGAILAIDIMDLWREFPDDLPKNATDFLNILQDDEGKVSANIRWQDCGSPAHRHEHIIWCNCRESAWAYKACGIKPGKPYDFVRPFLDPDYARKWVGNLAWDRNPWIQANKVLALHTCVNTLVWSDPAVGSLLEPMFEEGLHKFLDACFDSERGVWIDPSHSCGDLMGIGTTPHILPLYIERGWSVPDLSPGIDTVLRHQRKSGVAPFFQTGGNTSVDFDGIYILYNACRQMGETPKDTCDCVEHFLRDGLASIMYEDGGFPLYPGKEGWHGYNSWRGRGALNTQSATMPTWFYLATLGMARAILENCVPADLGFNFGGPEVGHLTTL